MSERERWIVYPLLFLALGAALRDKLAKQTRAENVVCERIYLTDSEGRPMGELTGQALQLGSAEIRCANLNAIQVNAQTLLQAGRPISQLMGQGVSWPQLLQFLQRLGALQVEPTGPSQPAQRH